MPVWYFDFLHFLRVEAKRSKPQTDGGHIPLSGIVLATRSAIKTMGEKKPQ